MSFFFLSPDDSDYAPLQDEISALFGSAAYDAVSHYTDFIDRFVAIIEDPASVSPAMRNYLLTEGGVRAMDGIPLSATHLLYWLDRQLKDKLRDEHELYTTRLSQAGAGWGEAEPDSLTEADPLDLVTTLEGLECKVVIVDNDADLDGPNNLDDESLDGFVRIGRADDNTVFASDGTTPKSPSDNLMLAGNLDYQFQAWITLDDYNESNSGNLRHPLVDTDQFVLVRASVLSDHIVKSENQIGCTVTPTPQQQARSITLRGYPGEWPEVWCGNSTDNDATPTAGQCPNTALNPRNNTSTIFRIGPASNKYRNNYHVRNIHFHGKRETAGGDYIFAETILDFTGNGTGHSVRFCKFTDCQPMRPDDADAAANPQYVDFAFDARGGDSSFTAIKGTSTGLVLDSNYIQPAPAGFPLPLTDETGLLGFTVTLDGTDQRFTRNRIEGRNIRSPLRLSSCTRPYVADNSIEAPYYKIIFCFECTDPIIERNYLYGNGGLANAAEAAGLDLAGSNGAIVRYNVIWVNETIIDGATCILARPGETTAGNVDLFDDAHIYGNILFGAGLTIGYTGGWDDADTTLDDVQNLVVEYNVIHEFPAANTAVTAAPVRIKLDGTLQADLGNVVRNNNITRDSGTDAIMMRTAHSAATGFAVTDTLDGVTGNTAVTPTFADSANGDLRITNSGPWDEWFAGNMPFSASLSQAWEPD